MVGVREEGRREKEIQRSEEEAKENILRDIQRRDEERRMKDPEVNSCCLLYFFLPTSFRQVLAYLRGGAQAAVMWCHRSPLDK